VQWIVEHTSDDRIDCATGMHASMQQKKKIKTAVTQKHGHAFTNKSGDSEESSRF
jgi:hypothetical protein